MGGVPGSPCWDRLCRNRRREQVPPTGPPVLSVLPVACPARRYSPFVLTIPSPSQAARKQLPGVTGRVAQA